MRKYLMIVAAVAVSAALMNVGTAFGVSPNIATVDGHFNPDNPGATYTKGGLFVETNQMYAGDPNAPDGTNPTLKPERTDEVRISFDKNMKFNVGQVPTCSDPLTGSAQDGMKACGDSYIGGGYATLCVASGAAGTACNLGVVNAVVSAYNGPVVGGFPTIKLQARADHTIAGPVTSVLTGTLEPALPVSNPYDKMLRVAIPPAGGGAASITQFALNVNNGSFVQAKCTNPDNDWDFRGYFHDVSPGSQTDTDFQPCT